MTLATGTRLGPYEVLGLVGEGGMGEVWKARDTRLDRIVAIKRLKADRGARFEQEKRAIAALNHPHICQIFDVGPDYLVMEFVEGAPLWGPLPAGDALRLAIQISGALEEAHARGILHRDLKPANILVAGKNAKLLDFGLAKSMVAVADATQTIEGKVVGTPAYMAPELAEGKAADARSDIFSFGAVLYEMLAGKRAFDGLAAVLREEPARLDSPAGEIARRCLAKRPSERFQSMAEVRAALEQAAARAAEQQPSIAVLPFANMSRDPDDEYFSDGLAEEILNVLTHIPGLKVIARTSSFAFRGKEQDIRRIAEALGVRTLLEGSVRRAANRIRVTAQLISAEDGSHLWSERYDREMADVFAVQDEIAVAITGALQVKLTDKAARGHQPNLPAYETLLKGRHQAAKYSPEGFERARKYFEQAIALDAQYAEPLAELGSCFFWVAYMGLRPAREVLPLARAAAARALELSASDSLGHAVLSVVAALYDYDWKEAGRQYRLALAADPVSPLARCYAAYHLLALGGFEEALREFETALEQDPLSLSVRSFCGLATLYAGMYDRAIDNAREMLEIDEHNWIGTVYISATYAWQGMFVEAHEPAERVFQLAPWHPHVTGNLAGILACLGERDRADEILAKIPETAPDGRVVYHMLCLEIDAAADWYEKSIELRRPMAALRASAAHLKPLRDSPRWPKLARMMNLPM